MRFSSSVLIVLVLPLLAGCRCAEEIEPQKVEIHVSATLVDGRIVIDKDERHHHTASVGPGDVIAWICENCPAGTEFAVRKVHLVANLEEMVRMLGEEPPSGPINLEADLQELGRVMEPPFIDGKITLRWVGRALVVTRDSRAQAAAVKQAEWAPSEDFMDGEKPVLSAPIPRNVGYGLWKFTWRVRLRDDHDNKDEWDPHIYTHPDPPGT